jgi:glycosyltransferase involved in cell wall biosynthesis
VQFPVQSFGSPDAFRGARQIARYVAANGIRIVHTWDYPLNVYAIPIARTMTKAIAISSQRSDRRLIPPFYHRLTRVSDRFAHAVVVNCDYLRRHLIDDEHIPERKIHVCHNGIDLEYFHHVSPGKQLAPLTIGTVCGLRPEKDLKTLIAAFARVRAAHHDLKLVIVGSGDELARLTHYALEAGIADATHFEPATAEVPRWLGTMDIFVLPSRSEAFSNSLMEAMACGCCPVASNVGGNPELVRPGETGLLFRAGDPLDLAAALRSLIENAELRRDLAARAEAFVRSGFSLEAAARRMGEIYSASL